MKSKTMNNQSKKTSVVQCPIIGSIQKIVVYETTSRFYLVGSNNIETRFKIIKIDRTEPKELVITSDNLEYTRREIKDLLRMIDLGNRPKSQAKGGGGGGGRPPMGVKRIHSAFGIVGFIRFLEGYYMVLITKRRRVAEVGAHTIYKVEDTSMVYIPSGSNPKNFHPDEQRYLRTFQNVDLSSNFYFSYSYDLTNSLQYNMTSCHLTPEDLSDSPETRRHDIRSDQNPPSSVCTGRDVQLQASDAPGSEGNSPPGMKIEVEDALVAITNLLVENNDDDDDDDAKKALCSAEGSEDTGTGGSDTNEDNGQTYVGVRVPPCSKFVWNEYLLKKVSGVLQYDWILHVVHGFVGQSNINVYNKNVYLTLIARRSSKFAGTRFLKRGANLDGSVANEVETEQIIFDGSLTSPGKIRFTSFVQVRGSIPLQWSQDGSVMVPKPPINLDQSDPYGAVAGRHFNQLMSRFGSPIIVLDLVKKKEKRPHESIISEEFMTSIRYLNQFLPVEHRIKYIGYDMAKISKKKDMDLFKKLDIIAEYCLSRTGFYQSKSGFYSDRLRPNSRCLDVLASPEDFKGRRQMGIVRTNCIDCLDRTNTAQYAIGKCALAKQLYSLGVLDDLSLDYDSDCIRMMEHMFEDQGDTLALQYGGSQLVHRIKGYRKVAPWTSSSRDIMQTLSRYYNNTFSDSDKQNAINLFLGKFVPCEGHASIWDLSTDFYLHNRAAVDITTHKRRSYSMWWDAQVLRCLPYAYHDESKGVGTKIVVKTHPRDERIDLTFDHYRPYELTTFDDLFVLNMANSVRDFMPKSSHDYSPFCARLRPGRRQDPHGNKQEANPNVSGKDSTGSAASTGSEGSLSGSEGSDINWGEDKEEVLKVLASLNCNSHEDLHPRSSGKMERSDVEEEPGKGDFEQRYGVSIQKPSPENMSIYSRYASDAALPEDDASLRSESTTLNVSPPYLDFTKPRESSPRSLNVYEEYVSRGNCGPALPSAPSMDLYRTYVATLEMGLTFDQRPFPLLTSLESRSLVTGEDFMGYARR